MLAFDALRLPEMERKPNRKPQMKSISSLVLCRLRADTNLVHCEVASCLRTLCYQPRTLVDVQPKTIHSEALPRKAILASALSTSSHPKGKLFREKRRKIRSRPMPETIGSRFVADVLHPKGPAFPGRYRTEH